MSVLILTHSNIKKKLFWHFLPDRKDEISVATCTKSLTICIAGQGAVLRQMPFQYPKHCNHHRINVEVNPSDLHLASHFLDCTSGLFSACFPYSEKIRKAL
jgi:hypothetical protein